MAKGQAKDKTKTPTPKDKAEAPTPTGSATPPTTEPTTDPTATQTDPSAEIPNLEEATALSSNPATDQAETSPESDPITDPTGESSGGTGDESDPSAEDDGGDGDGDDPDANADPTEDGANASSDQPTDFSEEEEAMPRAMPKVGTPVWHRLRSNREWVPAVVIDQMDGTKLDPPLDEEQLHLQVSLDRARHHAASTTGYRLNVPYGTEPGGWLPERPRDANAVFAREQEDEQRTIEIRKQQMRDNA